MFKVGDKITTLACRDILTVTAIGSGHFLKAKGFNCHGMKDGECNVLDFQVKLASPEEITAGHRINNDMGDDNHIENHVSPHCNKSDEVVRL